TAALGDQASRQPQQHAKIYEAPGQCRKRKRDAQAERGAGRQPPTGLPAARVVRWREIVSRTRVWIRANLSAVAGEHLARFLDTASFEQVASRFGKEWTEGD